MSTARPARRQARWLTVVEIASPVLLLVAWWFGSAGSQDPFFPPLQAILAEFQRLWLFDHFASDVLPSVGNLLLAYLISCVLGIGLGTALGLFRGLSLALDPVIQFLRSIPAVALLPILVALAGFGNEVRILSIVLAATFPVLIATVDGVRSTDTLLLEGARVYRLSRWERVSRIYLPSAGPQIFSGAQVSLQVAFIVMITSEMLGAAQGIGALTLLAQKSFDVKGMWAGILLLGVLGYLVNLLFTLVRRRVLSWHYGAQGTASLD